jgi:hypothetical protein
MARLAALLITGLALLTISACGDDDTPVAHVGDAVITRAQLDRQLKPTGGELDPDPPAFTKCIERLSKIDGGAGAGTPKERCRYEYLKQLSSALATLIHTEWVRQEAKAEGVSVSEADLEKARGYFGGDKVDDDLVETVALDDKLRAKLAHAGIAGAEVEATAQELAARHGSRREVLLVATGSQADAAAARRYLEAGASFPTVAKRYGNSHGGTLLVPKDARDDQASGYALGDRLRSAVFAAKPGVLIGPVGFDNRYFYVFRVNTTWQTGGQSAADLRSLVANDLKTAAAGRSYEEILAKRWLGKTTCEKGYVVGGGLIPLGGGAATYYSSAGCGNFVPFKTPAPGG